MNTGVSLLVPAHITGFFSVHQDDNPRVAGSRGAGVTLNDAVSITIRPADTTTIIVNDATMTIPAANYVLDQLDATARIHVETSVPLGAGFGVSGAIALGTAFGGNLLFDQWYSENELVSLAHSGDVIAGTGLGDVVAQHRGGAPIRREPGAPGYGAIDGIPDRRRIEWISLGELSTEKVLAGDTSTLNEAGAAALEELVARPTLTNFMRVSQRFSRETGLLTDQLAEIMADVEQEGGQAAMAMLGQTVFALGNDLSQAGYDPTIHELAPSGVSFVRAETDV